MEELKKEEKLKGGEGAIYRSLLKYILYYISVVINLKRYLYFYCKRETFKAMGSVVDSQVWIVFHKKIKFISPLFMITIYIGFTYSKFASLSPPGM